MASYDNAGRIPRRAADQSAMILFALALLTASTRIVIRLYYQKRLFKDDAFLILAIALLSTSVGLYFNFVDDMYLAEALILGDLDSVPETDLATIIPKSLRLHKISDVFLVLTWTSLNSVKFSFLMFFQTFTTRVGIKMLSQYWWFVAGFTTISWGVGVALEIVACPYFDERSLQCAQGPQFTKTIAIASVLIAFNVVSDILIVTIPLMILREITISLRSKIYLALSLCLSVATICTTIIRVTGLKLPGHRSVDVVWQVYWQFVEACIGIVVVSMMVFRTFFVQRAAKASAKRQTPYTYISRLYRRGKRTGGSRDPNNMELPQRFPNATLTGMRTFIQGGGEETTTKTFSTNPNIPQGSDDMMPLHKDHGFPV